MRRAFTASSLVVLPNLSATDAVALADKLSAVARPPKGTKGAKGKAAAKAPKLSPAIASALDVLVAARSALHKETSKVVPKPVAVLEADRAEDTAVGALHDLLQAWARLPASIAHAEAARRLLSRLFADGAAFVRERVEREWAIVEGKLASIDAAAKSDLAAIGALPMLDHLKHVHATYGEVIGVTAPRPETGPTPQVRKKLDTLLTALRDYVLQVAASSDPKKPETGARRDALLAPLASWSTPTPKKATKPTPKTAPTPGTATPPAPSP